MTTYRLEIVTSGIPEPLHAETFDAPDEGVARRLAHGFTKILVDNPEEEYGELYVGDGHIATISVARDEEDAR
jgi:hypothetical protein